MPSGDAEEIVVRVGVFRFFARLSAPALLERPTLILLLVGIRLAIAALQELLGWQEIRTSFPA
jgi:hypothetical protein